MIEPKKIMTVEDLSVIFDWDYLLENVGWGIDSFDCTLFVGNKSLWFWYDEDTNQIYGFTFDRVLCVAQHGFGGTSFDKYFYYNGELCEFKNSEGTLLDCAQLTIKPDKKILVEEVINNYQRVLERLNDQLDEIPFRIARLEEKINVWNKEKTGTP
jgi:hypothetical protein